MTTDNPDAPFGEMSGQHQRSIARAIKGEMDRDMTRNFIGMFPVVGPVVDAMHHTNLASWDNPLQTPAAKAYGEGTWSGLVGDYSADPGIQAATEGVVARQRASLGPPGNPLGLGPGIAQRATAAAAPAEEVLAPEGTGTFTPTGTRVPGGHDPGGYTRRSWYEYTGL